MRPVVGLDAGSASIASSHRVHGGCLSDLHPPGPHRVCGTPRRSPHQGDRPTAAASGSDRCRAGRRTRHLDGSGAGGEPDSGGAGAAERPGSRPALDPRFHGTARFDGSGSPRWCRPAGMLAGPRRARVVVATDGERPERRRSRPSPGAHTSPADRRCVVTDQCPHHPGRRPPPEIASGEVVHIRGGASRATADRGTLSRFALDPHHTLLHSRCATRSAARALLAQAPDVIYGRRTRPPQTRTTP